MKRILILATVLALLAVLAVPMAAYAGTEGSTQATGAVTAGSVEITVPGTFDLGNFVEGWNPSSGYTWSGYANVTVNPGTDPVVNWALTAQSVDDGNGNFACGKMYCDALTRYLDNTMDVQLYSSGAGYSAGGKANTGVTLSGAGNDTYQLGAAQDVTHNDAYQGAGSYYIFVKLTVAVVP